MMMVVSLGFPFFILKTRQKWWRLYRMATALTFWLVTQLILLTCTLKKKNNNQTKQNSKTKKIVREKKIIVLRNDILYIVSPTYMYFMCSYKK